MVVDVSGDERFPPLEGSDLYLYLHPDGVLSLTSSDGRVAQSPLPEVIESIHRSQSDGATVWVSGPDSPLGLAALDAIFESEPIPLQPWSATAPPVRWPSGANGFLAAARFGQDHILDDLCDRGVDLGWTDDEGNTALHDAAFGKNRHGVARLLREGADPTRRNDQGLTPEMISLAQATDPITRVFHDHGEYLSSSSHRFRNGHWLRRAVGAPVYCVVVAIVVAGAATGAIPTVAALVALGVLALIGLQSWRQTPPGLVASAYAIDGPRFTVLRGGFRRVSIDLRALAEAAYVGQGAGPSERYLGLGYFAIPSAEGKAWSGPSHDISVDEKAEVDVISRWPTVLIIEYDRMWRDEVVVPLARQLVLAGTEMTPAARIEIHNAVMLSAALAAGQRAEIGWPQRLRRLLRLRYRSIAHGSSSSGNADPS